MNASSRREVLPARRGHELVDFEHAAHSYIDRSNACEQRVTNSAAFERFPGGGAKIPAEAARLPMFMVWTLTGRLYLQVK